MRARMLLLGVLLSALPGTVPAEAADTTITLTGSRSGYVDVRFTRTVTVTTPGMTAETDGDYAGFALQRLADREVLLGSVQVPALDAAGSDWVGFGASRAEIAPGRYRLFLLTDGPATVVVPAAGLTRDLDLDVRRAVAAKAGIRDFGAATSVTHRVPIDTDGGSAALVAVSRYATVGTYLEVAACLRRGATETCATGDSTLAAGNVTGSVSRSFLAAPGTLGKGRSYGVMQINDAGSVGAHAAGFHLVFDVTP